MSNRTHLHHVLTAAAGLLAALCLSACGSASKPKSQAASHTSTAAAQTSSAAQTSTSTTTTTHSLSPATLLQARRAALPVLGACLRKHGIHVPSRPLSASNGTFNLDSFGLKAARHHKAWRACIGRALAVYNSATAAGR